MNDLELVNAEIAAVLEEVADSVPEVKETDTYLANTVPEIRVWAHYERANKPENYKLLLEWLRLEFLANGVELYPETLGGGQIGLSVYRPKQFALVTVDEGLGIYPNTDDYDLPLWSSWPSPYDGDYNTPRQWVKVMATVVKLTVLAKENGMS